MFPTDSSSFSLREPSRMYLSSIHRWRFLVCIWTAQRCRSFEDPGQATGSMSGFVQVAYHMQGRYSEARYTVSFRGKLAGQAQGSAQDVEPIPLYEANLLRCVEDQSRRNIPETFNNLKIASVDAVQMSALVPTAELKQPGQFVCSFNVAGHRA